MIGWKALLAGIALFVAMDALWLGVAMKGFYDRELGDLVRRRHGAMAPRWPAAALVYPTIPVGLLAFTRPAMGPSANAAAARCWGAAFGLALYGVYDLTNYAMLEKWTLKLTVADILWGTFLCGAVSAAVRAVGLG